MGKVLLEMKNIVKEFPGVKALDNVNLVVEEGEIHALCGENGAGKSTLMNVLSGIYQYGTYTGDIVYNGQVCKFKNIQESEKLGIVIIHQELALIPEMTIAENMFLGDELGSATKIDWNREYREARKYLDEVGLHESEYTLIKDIGMGKQQLVEIAKALAKNARLLILDEPTSSLSEKDSKHLLNLMLEFKKQGMTQIIISHKLNEVSYVADKITVIRDGSTIETLTKGVDEFTEDRIIKGMVGRDIVDRYPKRENTVKDEVIMEVKNWTCYNPKYDDQKVVKDVSFHVNKGEVLGICGLMGAGRTELAMSLFGESYGTKISGDIIINGKKVKLKTPHDAIKNKIAYVTEDRKGNGIILTSSIKHNTTLANLDGVSTNGVIDQDKETKVAKDYVVMLRTKCPNVEQNAGNLSGGNQQKVLLSKWMFTDPEIFILDEPTRGIDVGAKYEIYTIINKIVSDGKSVIMISSEMPEVLGMADRVYVMDEGKIVGEFKAKETSQEGIMQCIMNSWKEKNNE